MAQTTINGEWLEARIMTYVECVIIKTKLNTMVPTVTKGGRGQLTQSMKPGRRKVPTGIINKAVTAAGWTKVNVKRHVEGDNITNMEDVMKHYSVNVGHIDVRFMCDNGKSFNVAPGLKQFISAARAIDKDVCIFPLGGQYNLSWC
jgi:hypothetical protein